MNLHRSPRRSRGFTLIETLVAVGVAGILSSIAYPSLEGQMLRARRSDALVALLSAQMAQERHRANNAVYGSLADIGVAGTSTAGRYALRIASSTDSGYRIVASANGAQARDAECRHLGLAIEGGNLVLSSGADPSLANAAAVNRRCWSR